MGTHFFVLAVVGTGCAVTPRPPISRGIVTWKDVTTTEAEPVRDGFRRMAEGTEGVFPTRIAVCRVALRDGGGEDDRLSLAMAPAHDLLPWNGVFDPLRGVAEAFPLAEVDLQGHRASISRMAHAARQLDSGVLLLCSVPNRLSESTADVKGAYYDLRNGALLAVVHAQAVAPPPDSAERPDDVIPGDDRYADPEYLAARRFEQHALDCLVALREHDLPVSTTPPAGWLRPKDRPTMELIQLPEILAP